MPSLRTNLVKRIDRLPKPSNTADAMQPLFEAVSNSIHSTQDRFRENVARDGRVVVTIGTGRKQAPVKIVVEDNGNGLDERNFEAFSTTDTDNKYARGGKGVGRLLWLDCFEGIKVNSVYAEGDAVKRRSFRFVLSLSDQIQDYSEENLGNIHRFQVASSDRSLWRRDTTLPGRDQLGYPSKRGNSEHRKRRVW
ncbi:ATP-binding protein [Pararhizobium sp.]|uniref:ATP-binding protein n=1 Tax=Pararhizobium sp. TaxID=1977563 RepID=UPI003D12C3C9